MGRIAALFDLDHTLLDTSSGQLYARHLYRTGAMGRRQIARAGWWAFWGRLGVLDMEDLIPKMLVDVKGVDTVEAKLHSEQWFADDVIPHIAPRGLDRVAFHKEQGHVVAIVSASTQLAVQPMAAYLGIDGHYVCTHLESQDGRFTGRIVEPVCYGSGKVVWAERFAAEHDLDLDQSTFYSDSISDVALLERVGHPVAVNPDPRLRRLAQRRGWPIEFFY